MDCTYLVAITPGVVLGADVLVRILGAFLKRGHVLPVLPVVVPEGVGVNATADQAGDDSTTINVSSSVDWAPHIV